MPISSLFEFKKDDVKSESLTPFFDLKHLHILARISRDFNRNVNNHFSTEISGFMKNDKYDDINPLDKRLIAATMLGHYGNALAAIRDGANVNVKIYLDKQNSIWIYPIHLAACAGNIDVIKLLINNFAIFKPESPQKYYLSPLHYAAGSDHTHCIEYFLDLGVPVDQQSTICSPFGWNWSALQTCSNHGNLSGIKLLVDRGANIHLKDPDEFQAIHRAAASGSSECLQFLLDRGADPEAYNEDGVTPLMRAVMNEHTSCVQVLLEYKADPFQVNVLYRLYNCLQISISNNDLSTARVLLDFSPALANTDELKERNFTSLHIAAYKGFFEAVVLVLSYNSALIYEKSHGKTPLDLAKEQGHEKVITYLSEYEEKYDKNERKSTKLI